MKSKFKFYEIVKVRENVFTKKNGLNGLLGVILGKAKDDNGIWFYAVNFQDKEEGWDLPEESLEGTGLSTTREEYYDGSSIYVKVDAKTGEGKIENKNN
jgi:hypothetical protein